VHASSHLVSKDEPVVCVLGWVVALGFALLKMLWTADSVDAGDSFSAEAEPAFRRVAVTLCVSKVLYHGFAVVWALELHGLVLSYCGVGLPSRNAGG